MAHGWTPALLSRRLRDNPALHALDAGSAQEPLGPVTLILPWPPSANHRTTPVAHGRTILTRAVKEYKRQAALAILSQHRGYAPLSGPLRVHYDFHQQDQRRHDLDNLMKDIQDCCTAMHVWHDDSQIDYGSWQRHRGAALPYVKFLITKLRCPGDDV